MESNQVLLCVHKTFLGIQKILLLNKNVLLLCNCFSVFFKEACSYCICLSTSINKWSSEVWVHFRKENVNDKYNAYAAN